MDKSSGRFEEQAGGPGRQADCRPGSAATGQHGAALPITAPRCRSGQGRSYHIETPFQSIS